jgi:hypothetical protein
MLIELRAAMTTRNGEQRPESNNSDNKSKKLMTAINQRSLYHVGQQQQQDKLNQLQQQQQK